MVYRGSLAGPRMTPDGHHRPYPAHYFPFVAGTFVTELDVYLGSDFAPQAGEIVSLISLFDEGEGRSAGETYRVSFTVDLVRQGSGYFVLPHFPENGVRERGLMLPSAVAFPTDRWVRVRAELGMDRTVVVSQDGIRVSQGTADASTRIGTTGGHWGLYTGDNMSRITLLNDNIVLDVTPPR